MIEFHTGSNSGVDGGFNSYARGSNNRSLKGDVDEDGVGSEEKYLLLPCLICSSSLGSDLAIEEEAAQESSELSHEVSVQFRGWHIYKQIPIIPNNKFNDGHIYEKINK